MTITFPTRRPAPFQAVRTSRDLSLVAFAGALLVGFALQAGAFVPRLEPVAPPAPSRVEPAPERPAPAVVAARRTPAPPRRAVAAGEPAGEPTRAPAPATSPCRAPRG
jgi:hypothetical protein